MERYYTSKYHSLKHICIFFVFTFFSIHLNAQDKTSQQRKYDSIYVSNGIKKIAEQVDKNGWIKFAPNSNLKADDFFKNHKEKLGLNEKDEIMLKKVVSDNLGFKHYLYYQKHNGIKVEFSEIILHEENGILQKTSGTVIPQLEINIKPSLSEIQAYKYALDFLNAKFGNISVDLLKSLKKIESELVILPQDENLGIHEDYLSYKFDVYNNNPVYGAVLYIDAQNGTILLEDLKVVNTDAVGSANTLYSGTRSITTDFTGSTHRLRDYSRGADIFTFDMNNGSNFGSAVDFTDADNNWIPADAGHDAHWGIEMTYDYYQTYGRNSYDNEGAILESYVHTNLIGLGYSNNNNAFWDGTNQRMVFGDGDGVSFNPLTCIDVVAHELTHAVTDFTADLVYSYESGALNESFSDIFGTAVEFFAKPADANWLLGDEISTTGDPIRNMENPNAEGDPDTYQGTNWYSGSGDNGGVHTNSGVQNFWFHLLSDGGNGTNDNGDIYNVTGIGIENAEAIAYRNLTVYLTRNSNFEDAREGSIEAASDLFGKCSNVLTQVINAWNAVGVDGPSSVSTDIYACASIADETIYIASNNIYAGNYCSVGTTTINSGRTVIFRAGNTIRLNPGFQAQLGCTFKANVLNCGSGVLRSASITNNIVYEESNFKNSNQEQLSDINNQQDYIVYPNPTTGQVNIEIDNYKTNSISISVYDFSGSLILNSVAHQSNITINLSDKASGIYFMRIFDGNNTVTKKIIKN